MNTPSFLSLSALCALGLSACDRPPQSETARLATPLPDPVAATRTAETARLGDAMDQFERNPTEANAAAVKKTMARLDSEILELEERVLKTTGAQREEAAAKLHNLQAYRNGEALRFQARVTSLPHTAPPASPLDPPTLAPADARSGADKIEDGARRTGDRVEESAKKIGNALEDAARKTGDAIKDVGR